MKTSENALITSAVELHSVLLELVLDIGIDVTEGLFQSDGNLTGKAVGIEILFLCLAILQHAEVDVALVQSRPPGRIELRSSPSFENWAGFAFHVYASLTPEA